MNDDGQAFFQSLAGWWNATEIMLALIFAAACGNYLEHEIRALFSRRRRHAAHDATAQRIRQAYAETETGPKFVAALEKRTLITAKEQKTL